MSRRKGNRIHSMGKKLIPLISFKFTTGHGLETEPFTIELITYSVFCLFKCNFDHSSSVNWKLFVSLPSLPMIELVNE